MKKAVILSLIWVICTVLWTSNVMQDDFHRVFEDWLSHWENQNIDEYLAYYHSNFSSETSGQNFEQWSTHKRRLFNPLRPVSVNFIAEKVSIVDNLASFEAYQEYKSRNYSDFGRKTMQWVKENDTWKIISEDWVVAERPVIPPTTPPIEHTITPPVLPQEPPVKPPTPPVEPPVEPPIEVVVAPPDTLTPYWAQFEGLLPYEYINIILTPDKNYGEYLIVVEKKYQTAALYRFHNEYRAIDLLKTYNISSGQVTGNKQRLGDLKTPEGLYWTTQFIPAKNLAAKYGSGAFVLNYPNDLDRLRRKTGSGIWIHGSDIEMVSFDTEGCVRFDNEEILKFRNELKIDQAPVIINEELEWCTYGTLQNEVAKIRHFIGTWQNSWERQDIDEYLATYCADEFISHRQRMDYQKWEAHKRNIFSPEKQVRLIFTDFEYYYADNLLLVTFNQRYTADNYSDFGHKQLVLRRNDDKWTIIQEEWTERK